jgi:hypothetical protein
VLKVVPDCGELCAAVSAGGEVGDEGEVGDLHGRPTDLENGDERRVVDHLLPPVGLLRGTHGGARRRQHADRRVAHPARHEDEWEAHHHQSSACQQKYAHGFHLNFQEFFLSPGFTLIK